MALEHTAVSPHEIRQPVALRHHDLEPLHQVVRRLGLEQELAVDGLHHLAQRREDRGLLVVERLVRVLPALDPVHRRVGDLERLVVLVRVAGAAAVLVRRTRTLGRIADAVRGNAALQFAVAGAQRRIGDRRASDRLVVERGTSAPALRDATLVEHPGQRGPRDVRVDHEHAARDDLWRERGERGGGAIVRAQRQRAQPVRVDMLGRALELREPREHVARTPS